MDAPLPPLSTRHARPSALARACLPTTLYAKSSLAATRVALGHQARENLRTDAVHKSFLDAPPKHARLPGPSLLVTMLAVCEVPELPTGFGLRDGFFGVFQGAAVPAGKGIGLAHEDLLCHLGNGLISLHALLLTKGAPTVPWAVPPG
jgi:hypothetical protein